MSEVNGYELWIWRPIYHNGEFSHNLTRKEFVHAQTEKEAKAIIQLVVAETTEVGDSLTIRAGKEYIYSVKLLGRMTYEYVAKYVEEVSLC